MTKNLDAKGCRIDLDLLEKLKLERWIKCKSGLYKCIVHDTIFDYDEYEFEPCWQCYNKCIKNI